MERVNLLPEEARVTWAERILHRVDRDFPRLLAGIALSVLALGGVVSLGQGWSSGRAAKRLSELKQGNELLQVETQNMESFDKQLQQAEEELQRQKKFLEQKIAYLEAARSHPRVWAAVLKDLRRNIPSGVWLTDLEATTGGGLRVAGGASDENLVTQFMANLKASPNFSNVGFSYTEKDSIGHVAVIRFEIVCRVVAG